MSGHNKTGSWILLEQPLHCLLHAAEERRHLPTRLSALANNWSALTDNWSALQTTGQHLQTTGSLPAVY